MKCVKMKDGTIKRLMNFQAETLVDLNLAVYTSKEEWKKPREKK